MMLPRLIDPRWEVAATSVGDISLQFGREGSGIIAEGAVHPGGHTIFVPLAGLQFADGQPLHNHSVFVLDPGAELAIASQEAHAWCSVHLPQNLFNHEAAVHADPRRPRLCSQVVEIGPKAMTRLRMLLAELEHSLRIEPALTTSPAVENSIQEELLKVLRPIVAGNGALQTRMGRPSLPRREIVRRIVDEIEQREGEPLSVEDLARVTNVSERTLRNIFLEYYGLPPRRYLMIKRMHGVRSALKEANPESTSVTALAAHFGFWHFGRFSSEYRRLFGESPSHTLKCQPKRTLAKLGTS
jgi:AraC family ethanolamine operon transcriptional activator